MTDADESDRSGQAGALPGGSPTSEPDAVREPSGTKPADGDVALVYARTDDGGGYRILRQREQRLEMGELRALRHAQPIHGEVVRLVARQGPSPLYDVEVLAGAAPAHFHQRPAQVATDRYRQNWDSIFAPPGGGEQQLPN